MKQIKTGFTLDAYPALVKGVGRIAADMDGDPFFHGHQNTASMVAHPAKGRNLFFL